MTVVLLLVAFVLIVGGAFLFTNSVEWAGQRLGLAEGAVGSLLAAVATALPESVIPVIALIKGSAPPEQAIAIGAIIGAPFLLATLALALVGVSARAFEGRRDQDRRIEAEVETGQRDFVFFLAFFGLAVLLGAIGVPTPVRIGVAIAFVIAYVAYSYLTIRRSRGAEEEEPSPLYFDWTRRDPPNNFQLALQLAVSVAAIVGGAELFVTEIENVATELGVPLLVLALVLAPLATELPEKANSVIWVRSGKDSLALGNITGAMVFQASMPVAFGLAFTPWLLEPAAIVAGVIGLLGGAIGLWRLHRRSFGRPFQLVWVGLYAAFLAYTLLLS
jgi:cation:H+ antiporter